MLSFWERESFTQYDYIIIGSGITGLSLAAELADHYPQSNILILERGIFPTGASTKNAGFACVGSPTELLADLQTMPTDEVVSLVAMRHAGLKLLRQRLGDRAINYQSLGSYELLSQKELHCLDKLDWLNKLLMPIFSQNAFEHDNSIIAKAQFDTHYFKAAIVNKLEGQIDTGAMMKALLKYVQQRGVTIINGAEVIRWHDNGKVVKIEVKQHYLPHNTIFSTSKMAVCTNAFTKKLLPHLDIQPGRGQVIVTKPIKNLPFKGIFHFEEGYYYFRNCGNRVIFGGGRNLDKNTEATTTFAYNEKIMNHLLYKLQHLILPNTAFEIDMRWTGIMAFGNTKYPHLYMHSPNVSIGVKLSGMGVAIGSELGRLLANMIHTGSSLSKCTKV